MSFSQHNSFGSYPCYSMYPIVHFFLLLSGIPLDGCVKICLSIHLLRDISVFGDYKWSCLKHLYTGFLCECRFSFLLGKYLKPGEGTCLIRNCQFFKVIASFSVACSDSMRAVCSATLRAFGIRALIYT